MIKLTWMFLANGKKNVEHCKKCTLSDLHLNIFSNLN